MRSGFWHGGSHLQRLGFQSGDIQKSLKSLGENSTPWGPSFSKSWAPSKPGSPVLFTSRNHVWNQYSIRKNPPILNLLIFFHVSLFVISSYIIVSQILGLVQPLFIFLNSAGFLPYFIWWFEIPTLVEFRGFFWLKSPELVRDFTIILHINSTRTAPWSWTERARRSGLRPPMKKSWSIRSWKREPKMAVCICGSYIYMKNIELGWISKSRDYFQEANGATSPINIFGTNLRTDGRTI